MTISAVPPLLTSVLENLGLTKSPNGWNLTSTGDGISLMLNWNEDGAVKRCASPVRIKGMKSPSTLRRDHCRMQAYLQKIRSKTVSDTVTNSLPVIDTDPIPNIATSKEQSTTDLSTPAIKIIANEPPAEMISVGVACVPETSSTSTQCNPETVSCAVQCITDCTSVEIQCSQDTTSQSSQCDVIVSSDAASQTRAAESDVVSSPPGPAMLQKSVLTDKDVKVTMQVLARRKRDHGDEQFWVSWKNHPMKDTSWVNANDLDSIAIEYIKIHGDDILDPDTLAHIAATKVRIGDKVVLKADVAVCSDSPKSTSVTPVPKFPLYKPGARNFDHTELLAVHLQSAPDGNSLGTIYLHPSQTVETCIRTVLKDFPPVVRHVPPSRVRASFRHKRLKKTFSLEQDLQFMKLPNTGKVHVLDNTRACDELYLTLDFRPSR